MNGMNTSCTRIGTKLSASVVTMCRPVKASASSAMFRCSPIVTNLGQAGRSYLTEVSRPPAMFRVSSTSEPGPALRVRYHSGVEEVTMMALGATLLATIGPASAGIGILLMLFFPLASQGRSVRSCCVVRAGVARPARGGLHRPVPPDQAGGQARVPQPGQGRRAPDDRRRTGGVGVDAAARGHADR